MTDRLTPGWYEYTNPAGATTDIALVYEDGSVYFPEGEPVMGRHEFEYAHFKGRAWRLVRADETRDAT